MGGAWYTLLDYSDSVEQAYTLLDYSDSGLQLVGLQWFGVTPCWIAATQLHLVGLLWFNVTPCWITVIQCYTLLDCSDSALHLVGLQ